MSHNYILYAEKMREIRAARMLRRPLRSQLDELFRFVDECELDWRRKDRSEPTLGPFSER